MQAVWEGFLQKAYSDLQTFVLSFWCFACCLNRGCCGSECSEVGCEFRILRLAISKVLPSTDFADELSKLFQASK